LLEDPEIDHGAKQAALGELLGDTDELVRNFLLVVVEKGRAAELASIYEEFAALVAADEGRLEVELTTAYELSDDEAREILEQIEKS
jgi:F-type H+-transporting ATPase subunit delta